MKKTVRFVSIVCLLALTLSACSSQKTLTGADRDAVLAFSEALTENMLAGYNANDYAVFSSGFDQAMLAGIPEASFPDFYASIHGKIGTYQSREVTSVELVGGYYAVIYTAVFEQDNPVTMRVVFTVAAPNQISGLWFDSARLREK
jgi:predicted small secreted protein